MQLVVPVLSAVPLRECASVGAWVVRAPGEALCHPSEAFPCSLPQRLRWARELTVSIWTVSEKLYDSKVVVDEEQEGRGEGHQGMHACQS